MYSVGRIPLCWDGRVVRWIVAVLSQRETEMRSSSGRPISVSKEGEWVVVSNKEYHL